MIDPAQPDELPALAAMLRGLNALHVANACHRFHNTGSDTALCDMLRREMAHGAHILVYRTTGVPRGYLMWRVEARAETPLEHARRLAVLDHIYVEPNLRRHGMGRRLIARFEAEAMSAGCTGWIARVHGFNVASAALMERGGAHPAVRLYEKRFQTPV